MSPDLVDQSRALFQSLGLDSVEGLPPHILRLSLHLDIASDHQPTVSLERMDLDEDGKFQADSFGSLRTVVERYVLITLSNNRIIAEKY